MTHDIATPEGRAELREMCKQATPGEWSAMRRAVLASGYCDTYEGGVLCRIVTAEDLELTDSEGRHWSTTGTAEANASLIAAAHNNLIPLLDRIDALADALMLILPMAKGYAARHRVGSNAKYIEIADRLVHPELYREEEP